MEFYYVWFPYERPSCIFPSFLIGLQGAVKSTWSLGNNILKQAARKNPSLICLEMNSRLDQKCIFIQHKHINKPKSKGASKALQVGIWLISQSPRELQSMFGKSVSNLARNPCAGRHESGSLNWSWSYGFVRGLQQRMAISAKQGVVGLWSLFW